MGVLVVLPSLKGAVPLLENFVLVLVRLFVPVLLVIVCGRLGVLVVVKVSAARNREGFEVVVEMVGGAVVLLVVV